MICPLGMICPVLRKVEKNVSKNMVCPKVKYDMSIWDWNILDISYFENMICPRWTYHIGKI